MSNYRKRYPLRTKANRSGKMTFDNYIFDLYGTLVDIRTDEEWFSLVAGR